MLLLNYAVYRKFICWLRVSLLLLFLIGCAEKNLPHNGLPEGNGLLKIDVRGFRNDLGQAVIHLYHGPKGFPDQPAPGMRTFIATIQQGCVSFEIPQLPFGAYAIGILHDENSSGGMDKGLFGRPQEGFGISLNPSRGFGPPKYSQARFLLIQPQMQQRIEIRYPVYPRKLRWLLPDFGSGN